MYRQLRVSVRALQQVLMVWLSPFVITRHGLPFGGLCLFLIAFAPHAYPESPVLHSSVEPLEFFYQQLRQSRDHQDYRERKSLFNRMANRYPDFDNLLISPQHEEDLVYNYLWMQQHQQGYRHRDGTDGANKLLRMGGKALYKAYYGSSNIKLNSDDDISSSFSDIEYKLGVSTDKVRLGLEYDF
jgi:hypothetical protein